jgi:hypothetical protein
MDAEITRVVAVTVVVAVLVFAMEGSTLMPLPETINNVGTDFTNPILVVTSAVAVSVVAAGVVHYGLFTGAGPPILNSVKTAVSRAERRIARLIKRNYLHIHIYLKGHHNISVRGIRIFFLGIRCSNIT